MTSWEVVAQHCLNEQWKLTLLTPHSVTTHENQNNYGSESHLIDRKLDVWVLCQTKQTPKNKWVKLTYLFCLLCWSHSSSIWVPVVCRTENENTSAETQIRTDIRYRRKHAHTATQRPEYDEWCLGSGGCTSLGRRTNFVPSSVLCLSFLVSDEPAETVGNDVSVNSGGITRPWLGQTLSYSLYCVVCCPHGSLKVSRSALWWWITCKHWKSSWVSCSLQCPMFIIGHCVESSVSSPASGCAADTVSLHWQCLTNQPHRGLCCLLMHNLYLLGANIRSCSHSSVPQVGKWPT